MKSSPQTIRRQLHLSKGFSKGTCLYISTNHNTKNPTQNICKNFSWFTVLAVETSLRVFIL